MQERRSELNRINVFPVPDGDTGTNLALTVAAIVDGLRNEADASVSVVAHRAADSAILGARGNCGMILSHFLLGFANAAGSAERMTAATFARALDDAVRHVYASLEKPVEGTIITVMREVAEEANAAGTEDFADLIEMLLTRARDALERTPEMLPVLKKAGVVDAGAKGFVHLFEGIVAYVHGDPFVALETDPVFDAVEPAAARIDFPEVNERFRFCTEALVRGKEMPDAAEIRAALRERGDSLIVIRSDDVLKLHIHTDEPDAVFAYLRGLGRLATHKAEDMAVQHAAVERSAGSHLELARRPISILVDSACNLPDEVVRAHGMHVVPMLVVFEREALRDGIDIDSARFVERLSAGEHVTTSQPAPASFIEGFRRAARDGETVLAVLVGSVLSGTLASAQAAAKKLDGVDVRIFDSLGAGMTQGMLALRAAELAEAGMATDRVIAELTRIRQQSGTLLTVEIFDHLLRSGRVGRGKVMIAGLLDIKPILLLGRDGRVGPLANVRGSQNVRPRLVEKLVAAIPADARAVRFGIMHVGRPSIVEEVSADLRAHWPESEILDAPCAPVIATHLGPGAWGVAWQVED
jgi:DegV family protein with EDD domain